MKYHRLLLLIPLLLCACASTPPSNNAVTDLYCARYLFYAMCAQDVTADGQTDFVYFEDSNEIFLFNEKLVKLVPANLKLHKCAQSMDAPLIGATSLLLTVDDDTSFMRRTEIKNGIFYHYMRYVPRISRCNRQFADAQETEEDDFGVAENSEFGL